MIPHLEQIRKTKRKGGREWGEEGRRAGGRRNGGKGNQGSKTRIRGAKMPLGSFCIYLYTNYNNSERHVNKRRGRKGKDTEVDRHCVAFPGV